jgi:hypothetical protein
MSLFQREFDDVIQTLQRISKDIVNLRKTIHEAFSSDGCLEGISRAHLDGYDDIAGETGRLQHTMEILKSEYEVAVQKLSEMHEKLADLGLEKKSKPPVVPGQLLEARWKMGAYAIVTSCEHILDELYRDVFRIGVVHKPIDGCTHTYWLSNEDNWIITNRHCTVEEALTHDHPFVRQLGVLLKAQQEFNEVYRLKGK